MMSETSRSLIAAAREGLAPDAAVAARVRAKIAAATGVAAATGAAVAVAVPKATTGVTVAKILGALLAVSVVASVAVVTRPDRTTPRAPQLELRSTEQADEIRAEVHVVAPSDSTMPPAAKPRHDVHATHAGAIDPLAIEIDPAEDASTATPPQTSGAADNPHTRRQRGSADEDFDSISLSREVELIDLAMVSLRKNVPHAALEAIKAYNRETGGRGQMAEDAAAIEIEARCLQDMDVTALLDRFDHKWPESAQRERVQTTCFARK